MMQTETIRLTGRAAVDQARRHGYDEIRVTGAGRIGLDAAEGIADADPERVQYEIQMPPGRAVRVAYDERDRRVWWSAEGGGGLIPTLIGYQADGPVHAWWVPICTGAQISTALQIVHDLVHGRLERADYDRIAEELRARLGS